MGVYLEWPGSVMRLGDRDSESDSDSGLKAFGLSFFFLHSFFFSYFLFFFSFSLVVFPTSYSPIFIILVLSGPGDNKKCFSFVAGLPLYRYRISNIEYRISDIRIFDNCVKHSIQLPRLG